MEKRNLKKKTSRLPNNMDYMYVGYILSNPVVYEQYKEAEKLGI